LMMSLWDALRMNMMISYQELVRTFPSGTQLKYTTGYVRTNAATPVTEGPVKGVATFTIDYTL
ncbi:hypothetical protein AAGM73_25390, partial [Klebsiella pneumoniae]